MNESFYISLIVCLSLIIIVGIISLFIFLAYRFDKEYTKSKFNDLLKKHKADIEKEYDKVNSENTKIFDREMLVLQQKNKDLSEKLNKAEQAVADLVADDITPLDEANEVK